MSPCEKPQKTTDSDDDEYYYEYAPGEQPSEAVVTAVAEATDRPIVPSSDTEGGTATEALPSLYHVVDPDALDAFVLAVDRGTNGSVSFDYSDHTVTVSPRAVTVSSAD